MLCNNSIIDNGIIIASVLQLVNAYCDRFAKTLLSDINGEDKTGFSPYIHNGEIQFDHRWVLLIGKK